MVGKTEIYDQMIRAKTERLEWTGACQHFLEVIHSVM